MVAFIARGAVPFATREADTTGVVTTSRLFSADVQQTLDLIGIFVFALSGGLLAVRKNLDIFGIAVLAEATALGGGLIRDVIIGAVPPAAFENRGYFLTPLVAAAVVFFLHPEVARINNAVHAISSKDGTAPSRTCSMSSRARRGP